MKRRTLNWHQLQLSNKFILIHVLRYRAKIPYLYTFSFDINELLSAIAIWYWQRSAIFKFIYTNTMHNLFRIYTLIVKSSYTLICSTHKLLSPQHCAANGIPQRAQSNSNDWHTNRKYCLWTKRWRNDVSTQKSNRIFFYSRGYVPNCVELFSDTRRRYVFFTRTQINIS